MNSTIPSEETKKENNLPERVPNRINKYEINLSNDLLGFQKINRPDAIALNVCAIESPMMQAHEALKKFAKTIRPMGQVRKVDIQCYE